MGVASTGGSYKAALCAPRNLAREKLERFCQALLERGPRLPTQQGASFRDVWAAAGWVVLGQGFKAQVALRASHFEDGLRALEDSEFRGVADIHRQVFDRAREAQ